MTSKTILPKPAFSSCDETSLKLHWDALPSTSVQYKLQYKQAFQNWEQAQDRAITNAAEIVLTETDLVDLEPGTPYAVRLVAVSTINGDITCGPEVVFDTKPIDCTPKGKRCAIS
jgi:hypothetical protein